MSQQDIQAAEEQYEEQQEEQVKFERKQVVKFESQEEYTQAAYEQVRIS